MKTIFYTYLIIGVLWSVFIGYPFGLQLDEYKDNLRYYNRFTSLTKNYLSDDGNLILCIKGRLAYRPGYPTNNTYYSLSIPIKKIESNKIYKDKYIDMTDPESNVITISDKLIANECDKSINGTKIQVKKAGYTPREAYYFYSGRDLKGMKPDNDKEYMVFVVPTASDFKGLHFIEPVRLFIILKNEDVAGRNFYIVGLEPTWMKRDIGFGERAIAYIKDAYYYPVAIAQLFGLTSN